MSQRGLGSEKALGNTHRSGNGRRKRAVVHVGFIVHIGHHDVSWVTGVRVAFAVHVLVLACYENKINQLE